jgi:thiol-disulfide isomerase/thioredoxin
MNGQTIYLENYLWYLQLSNQKTLDSTVIRGNKFEFKGKTDSSYMALLAVENKPFMMVFVENGRINIDIPEDIDQSTATGTELNDLFNSYNQGLKPIIDEIKELIQYANSQARTDELELEVQKKYNDLSNDMTQLSIKFLEENPGTIFSAYLLLNVMSQKIDETIIQSAYEKFDEQVKNSTLGSLIFKEIEKAKFKDLAVGEKFRDLTFKTPEDKEISISDYAGKGKYVLLDFWASWCGPCRAENPSVVALYKEYHNKGFEIVGVSLDNNKDNWIKGIKDDGITWPQMSDLKGWNSEAAVKYNIRGIPFTVLLDKEGNVIAINLKGEELRNKIKTLIQ